MFFVGEAKSGKVTTKNKKKIVWKGEFLFRGSSILWKLPHLYSEGVDMEVGI